MKEFWNTIQLIFTAIGGWLGYFLGGCDGLLYALIAFVVVDYITGVMCAATDKKLSSEVGFKGIAKKVLVFLLVVNQGHVLTYSQIYQKIWGGDALGNESNTIKCHIRNLWDKLNAALPDAAFTIRCEREVGYCFELDREHKNT